MSRMRNADDRCAECGHEMDEHDPDGCTRPGCGCEGYESD